MRQLHHPDASCSGKPSTSVLDPPRTPPGMAGGKVAGQAPLLPLRQVWVVYPGTGVPVLHLTGGQPGACGKGRAREGGPVAGLARGPKGPGAG